MAGGVRYRLSAAAGLGGLPFHSARRWPLRAGQHGLAGTAPPGVRPNPVETPAVTTLPHRAAQPPNASDTRPWLLAQAAAGLAALLLWSAGASAARWDWQPALAGAEPWRAITAALLHGSGLHLAANLAGCVLVAALGRAAGCGRSATLAWLLAWPMTQLGLLAQPALAHYVGLSGALHAAVVVAAMRLVLVDAQAARRTIGALLLAGVAIKLLLEAPWSATVRAVPGWDILVAPGAHVSGALAGALCALLLHRRLGD